MSPDLDRLVTLQRLDSQIHDARHTIASHPQRLAEADARLNEAKAVVDAVQQRLKDNHDGRRALEKEAAVFQGRLSKYRDQQGAVKTNKEYQALGHEIEVAQTDLAGIEEREIELMVGADTIAADLKVAEAAYAAKQKEIEAEKKALSAELARVEASLTEATASRQAIIGEVNPRLMAVYNQVAKARKGLAIAPTTRDGLCSACHVRLRPQVFQLVRQNDSVIQCDSCQRILYYIPPPPPVDPPVVVAS